MERFVAVAPTDCTVVQVKVAVGDEVSAGAVLAVVEVMKIEHLVTSDVDGTVESVAVTVGDVLDRDDEVARVFPGTITRGAELMRADNDTGMRAEIGRAHV